MNFILKAGEQLSSDLGLGLGLGSIIVIENIIISPIVARIQWTYNGPATKTRLKIHNKIFPQDEMKGHNCVSQANTGTRIILAKTWSPSLSNPGPAESLEFLRPREREREDILR